MENLKYTIQTPNEDPKLAVIFKEGITATFTVQEIEQSVASLTKVKQEIQSTVSLQEAYKQNVLDSNPEVKDMDSKVRTACFIYEKASQAVETGLKKLQEIEDVLKGYENDLSEIKKQTNLNV